MLSAFIARPIVELKARDKSKIESILAYGDRILAGLHSGSLRIYRVNEVPEDDNVAINGQDAVDSSKTAEAPTRKAREVDLLREVEKFSKRPIQQLAIIKEANILISLSDGYVSIHRLEDYALQERLEKTKGATTFAVTSNIVKDAHTGIPSIRSRLAVAVKRKIILWSWEESELTGDTVEMAMASTVKSLTWATGSRLVAGMDPGYSMVDVESRTVTDIIKSGSTEDEDGQGGVRFGAVNTSGMGYMGMGSWVPKPMATRLSEGQVLLARDVNTLFIDENGKVSGNRRQIPWHAAPEAVGYSYPYLLALQQPVRGALEVRNPDTLSLLQKVSLPEATLLHVPRPNISLAHAGKGFLVASERCIWRMAAQGYEAQIDELVDKERYDEAISLLNLLEDTLIKEKEDRLRETRMLKAEWLFKQRKYREALDLFTEASAPPERVIAPYPRSIAGDLSMIESRSNSGLEDCAKAATGKNIPPDGEPVKEVSGEGDQSTLDKPRTIRKRDTLDAGSIKSLERSDPAAITPGVKKKNSEPLSADKPLEGKDLLLAVSELRPYLAQVRKQLQQFLNLDGSMKGTLDDVDQKPTEQARPAYLNFIARLGPVATGLAQKLHQVAILVDTTLFRAYMVATPALAGSLFRIDNFCDPTVVKEKLYGTGRYHDLIDFLHGKKLHKEALDLLEKFGKGEADEEVSPQLKGPARTVAYLQQLPPDMIDVILQHMHWPLEADPDLAMRVFLADTENAETLPRERVLSFLEDVDPELAIKYLEHVIRELNDQTPDFHQKLINLYMARVGGQFTSEDERNKAINGLKDFLQTSTQYNKYQVLRTLPAKDPAFQPSRAVVLSKMGQHKQALQIYVFDMEDYRQAEEYCNSVYLSSYPSSATVSTPSTQTKRAEDADEEKPTIYHTLLSLYLTPPPPYKPNWPPALDLLSRHGARLPASSTLSLIPPSLPVADLSSYFTSRIRAATSLVNLERIASRLRGVEKVNVEAQVLFGNDGSEKGGRSRRVVIGEERVCGVCHKRFGGSAVRVFPDGAVVHYGCAGRREVGLVTTTGRAG